METIMSAARAANSTHRGNAGRRHRLKYIVPERINPDLGRPIEAPGGRRKPGPAPHLHHLRRDGNMLDGTKSERSFQGLGPRLSAPERASSGIAGGAAGPTYEHHP